GISVADVDAGSGNIKVTFSVGSGTLSVNTTVCGGRTGRQESGNGTGTVILTAPLSAINTTLADLAGLRFKPALNAKRSVALSMTTDDQGNSGSGGALSDSDTSSISVSAVNDAPANTLPPTFSTSEDTTVTLSGISVLDVDAGVGNIKVTFSVGSGTLSVNTT